VRKRIKPYAKAFGLDQKDIDSMKILFSSTLLVLFVFGAMGQTPSPSPAQSNAMDLGITPNLALGDVTSIDAVNQRMTVKTKDGDIIVVLDDKTEYKKVKPGETSLKNAEPAVLTEINVGDRVIALGRVSDDRKSVPAKRVVLMTRAAIVQKQERDREAWKLRGIVGRIASLNVESREINLLMRAAGGERSIAIPVSEKVTLRRYAPDSVKFSDARPSSFEELKVGDQVRALGDKSADGARFTAEEIVSGSFRMVAGAISAINASTNEITIASLQNGLPIVIAVKADSLMRRIPPEMAAMMAQRRAQVGPGGNGGPPPAPPSGTTAGPRQPGGRGGDFDDLLERLPAVTINELKKGDVIGVSGTAGVDPSRVTAIKLVSGVEPLLTQPQAQTGRPTQSPSLNLPGLESIGGP
jgi:hypothetical protein